MDQRNKANSANAVYILVLGNFAEISQAEQYQAQALLKGFPVKSKIKKNNGTVSYQLFTGPYSGLVLASQQKKTFTGSGGMTPTLVKLTS